MSRNPKIGEGIPNNKGNYNELCEVIELAKNGIIKHQVQKFSLSEVNEAIDLLVTGNINGCAVIVPYI